MSVRPRGRLFSASSEKKAMRAAKRGSLSSWGLIALVAMRNMAPNIKNKEGISRLGEWYGVYATSDAIKSHFARQRAKKQVHMRTPNYALTPVQVFERVYTYGPFGNYVIQGHKILAIHCASLTAELKAYAGRQPAKPNSEVHTLGNSISDFTSNSFLKYGLTTDGVDLAVTSLPQIQSHYQDDLNINMPAQESKPVKGTPRISETYSTVRANVVVIESLSEDGQQLEYTIHSDYTDIDVKSGKNAKVEVPGFTEGMEMSELTESASPSSNSFWSIDGFNNLKFSCVPPAFDSVAEKFQEIEAMPVEYRQEHYQELDHLVNVAREDILKEIPRDSMVSTILNKRLQDVVNHNVNPAALILTEWHHYALGDTMCEDQKSCEQSIEQSFNRIVKGDGNVQYITPNFGY